jgi:transcription initiation factor TFIID TATA-box-binding protein
LICSGAKSQVDVEIIISELTEKLNFLEVNLYKSYQIEIKNMVFTKNFDKKINLSKVALEFGLENVDYEPDDFPGLVFKVEEPAVTFIIFESGKVICTGAESNSNAETAYIILERKFRKHDII